VSESTRSELLDTPSLLSYVNFIQALYSLPAYLAAVIKHSYTSIKDFSNVVEPS